MAPKQHAKHQKPRSREQQRAHLGETLSTLVELAESAAELHVAAARTAFAISELLDALDAIEEAKPRR